MARIFQTLGDDAMTVCLLNDGSEGVLALGGCVRGSASPPSTAGPPVPDAVRIAQINADTARQNAQLGLLSGVLSSFAGAGASIGSAVLGKSSLQNPNPFGGAPVVQRSSAPGWLVPGAIAAVAIFAGLKIFKVI